MRKDENENKEEDENEEEKKDEDRGRRRRMRRIKRGRRRVILRKRGRSGELHLNFFAYKLVIFSNLNFEPYTFMIREL